MRRVITINSNQVNKSIETKKILTEKLINEGFEVTYKFCKDAELIISIGGDGSFLKTVHDFNFTQIPIIGINTGHLGFFPEISPENIDNFIKSYKNNNFWVQDISLLNANIYTNNYNDVTDYIIDNLRIEKSILFLSNIKNYKILKINEKNYFINAHGHCSSSFDYVT